ncbi:MAG: hypothetical protein DMG68_08270, partial [Acidobacteria bacterium]
SASAEAPRRVFYGLPCSNCGTYYASNLSECPICSSSERVPATAVPKAVVQQPESVVLPEGDELEVERERFLKEFKSQLYAAHTQINTAATFRCSLEQNHNGSYEAAEVCKPCYENLQQRADQMEAALHIDLKEAAQIVFDAVWSDPSDPGKTYLNAAQALLTELRKRAGINMLMTTHQPYKH